MTENFDAALGFPAGPLAEPATYWRAPRFGLLHADPDCQALRDWRTGCWPGTGDRSQELPEQLSLPVAAVLTGAEPACPCAHRLPAVQHEYRRAGQLLADLRAHRDRLAEPDVDVLVDALLLLDAVDQVLAADSADLLRPELTGAAAALAGTAEAARTRLAGDRAHRAELLTGAVITGALSGTDVGSLHSVTDQAVNGPVAGDRRVGDRLSVDTEALRAVRWAWVAAYVRTGELAAATGAALADPFAARVVVDRWTSSGNARLVPDAARAHVRHACTVWASAMRAAEAIPQVTPAQLLAFPDWRAALLDVSRHGEQIRNAARRLFALCPVHRVGDAAFVAADPLELAFFEEQAGRRAPRRVTFGDVPGGDWRRPAELAWQLWTDAGGPSKVLDDPFADDLDERRRRTGTLADPYNALVTAVGILADQPPAAA